MARIDDVKNKFSAKLGNRKTVEEREAKNYHPIFSEMGQMALGEEIQDDIWNIVRVPGGYIVKRVNMGMVFIPQT
jgi:hypothetical protein